MDAAKEKYDVVDIAPFMENLPSPSSAEASTLSSSHSSSVPSTLPTPLPLPPKTAAYYPNAPVDRVTEFYNFNHPNRGQAIIFNQYEFFDNKNYGSRKGTHLDAEFLEREFSKLQFDVKSYIDLTLEQISGVIDRTSKMDHSQNDCVLFVILSHGHLGSFSTYDSVYVLDDLFNAFTADKCPTLAGKPKIFIIQTCRTGPDDSDDKGIDKGIVFGEKTKKSCAKSKSLKDYTDSKRGRNPMDYSLPSQSDFLVVYSTSPGFFSFRTDDGSHFIQALCKELSANATKLPMYSILTNVNRHIATTFEANAENRHIDGAKQMPCLHSTLTRILQFNDKTCNNTDEDDTPDSELIMENSKQNKSIAADDADEEKSICSKMAEALFCFR